MPQLLRDAAAPQPPMALRAPSTLPAPHVDLRSPRSLAGWAQATGQADSEDLICSAAAAARAAETDRDRRERARRGILERIHRVRSYVEFRLLLGMQSLQLPHRPCCVPDFPLQQQAELLAALGGRLMALPYPEQVLAIRDFLAQPPGPACDGLLAELRAAALLGTEGLRRRERALFDEGGMAHAAV